MRSSSSPFRPHELPSSFLPYLPRSQTTLSPLIPQNLIRQIDQLRAIYLPLIHGAFGATDIFDSDEKVDVSRNGESERTKYDTTLAGSAVGLGLGLNIDSSSGGGSVDEILLEQIENDESVDDMADNAEDDSSQLDTFEREWAERWLNGVIRRAQNWLEAQESLDEEQGAVCEDGQAKFTNMEAVLREATAVLEMMAGTSGELVILLKANLTDTLQLLARLLAIFSSLSTHLSRRFFAYPNNRCQQTPLTLPRQLHSSPPSQSLLIHL